MLILGIDAGSSFLKAWVFEPEEPKVLWEQERPMPGFTDTSGPRREIPMEKLAALVKGVIDQALGLFPVRGIVFSVQMHGFGLFDGPDPVTDYVSWQDTRGFGQDKAGGVAARLRNLAGDELFRRNGVEPLNSHSVCPLWHLVNERGYRKPLDFVMMGDALARCLTGETAPIHPTVAASSGLLDLEKGDWNRALIERLSLDHLRFPRVSEGNDPAGFYASGGREVPVYPAVGDHQAAVLGCGAGDGDVVINIGTGGQLSYVDPALCYGPYETRPYFSGRSLRALTQLPSGRALKVLMDFLVDTGRKVFGLEAAAEPELWDRVNGLAQEAESAGKLRVDLSFFDDSGGFIKAIGPNNLTAGGLFSGAYEFMAETYCQAYKQMGLELPLSRAILGAGGVLRKAKPLQESLARRFGKAVRLSPGGDVMVGLARLARWHVGLIEEILPLS